MLLHKRNIFIGNGRRKPSVRHGEPGQFSTYLNRQRFRKTVRGLAISNKTPLRRRFLHFLTFQAQHFCRRLNYSFIVKTDQSERYKTYCKCTSAQLHIIIRVAFKIPFQSTTLETCFKQAAERSYFLLSSNFLIISVKGASYQCISIKILILHMRKKGYFQHFLELSVQT